MRAITAAALPPPGPGRRSSSTPCEGRTYRMTQVISPAQFRPTSLPLPATATDGEPLRPDSSLPARRTRVLPSVGVRTSFRVLGVPAGSGIAKPGRPDSFACHPSRTVPKVTDAFVSKGMLTESQNDSNLTWTCFQMAVPVRLAEFHAFFHHVALHLLFAKPRCLPGV